MGSLIQRIRVVMAAILDVLSRDEDPSDLAEELRSLWELYRPNDLEGVNTLLKDLSLQPDMIKLADAPYKYEDAEAQSRADLVAWNRVITQDSESQPRDPIGKIAAGGRQGWMYPVFFGTNRENFGESEPNPRRSCLTSEVMHFGRCDVWIPATHRFGETGNSFWKRWARLEFADDHLALKSTTILSEQNFWAALQAEMANSESGSTHGVVFLHGYNTSFQEAAICSAQIGFDLKVNGATAFFSWPSQGTLRGYPSDAAAIEGSEEAISHFLASFVRNSGADVVHLVAHSMGNRGLLRALQRLSANAELFSGIKFGQIFLAAPDVDKRLFLSLSHLYSRFSERTTLYASDGDKAVASSAWLHGSARAGYFNSATPITVAAGIDSIAVPNFDIDLLGHSYFAKAEALLNDIFTLIEHDTPPAHRQRLYSNGSYWELGR